jgi:PPK2 family polyphosphate:nucleotide phosphotransferase
MPKDDLRTDSGEAFRVPPGKKVHLDKRPTRVKPLYNSRKHYRELIERHIAALAEQQAMLYADHNRALLLIFQAMDAAGKDSAIKHVMSGVNPQGCEVHSFKHPSATELAHDFLWRTTRALPERGHIGIFNRSYYEEVLIVRVQKDILRAEGLPPESLKARRFWKDRFQSIAGLERHLWRNGTHIIKFFLHVSRDEQRQRFLARIDEAEKNWKFSMADMEQRQYWDAYQEAYEDCMRHTSVSQAPWYVVPADDKPNAHLIISAIILEKMKSLRLAYPTVDAERRRELQAIRKQLSSK